MKNMKISAKLLLGFIIVALIAAIVGVVGIVGIRTIDGSYTDAYINQSQPIPTLSKVIEYSQRMRVQLRNLALYSGDAEKLAPISEDVSFRISEFERYLTEYDATIVDSNARRLYDEAKTNYFNVFKPGLLEIESKAKAGAPLSELMEIMGSTTAATDAMVANFDECMTIKVAAAEANSEQNTETGNFMLTVMIIVIVIGVAVAMILAVYISRIVSKPVISLEGLMNNLVKTGDFHLDESDMEIVNNFARYKDEAGSMSKAFSGLMDMILSKCETLESVADSDLTVNVNCITEQDTIGVAIRSMVDNLNKMFAEINSSSNQVSTGSVQIADGAQLLAQGATEQSATVEELSASVTEIAEQTKANASTANETSELAMNIKVSAEQGSRQMDQMMTAVAEINESSKSIGRVIKIIDDIAFQTNILALNAAVEAARAGQHGKGFAVVADEVRSLAAKSADAAKNTNELIESSIQKAEMGASISAETSESLQQIVSGILKTSEMVASIARSSNEQSIAIGQIGEAIEQVSQVVQQNSATAEESAAASEEMSGQATILQQLIAQFKLKGISSGHVSGMVSAPSAHIAPISAHETGFAASSSSDKY